MSLAASLLSIALFSQGTLSLPSNRPNLFCDIGQVAGLAPLGADDKGESRTNRASYYFEISSNTLSISVKSVDFIEGSSLFEGVTRPVNSPSWLREVLSNDRALLEESAFMASSVKYEGVASMDGLNGYYYIAEMKPFDAIDVEELVALWVGLDQFRLHMVRFFFKPLSRHRLLPIVEARSALIEALSQCRVDRSLP